MMWVEEEEEEVAASFHNNWELAQLPCIFAWGFCHNNRWFWMMIRISTIWRLVFVAQKRNVPSSCNIIAFFWVPVPFFCFHFSEMTEYLIFSKNKRVWASFFYFSDYYISFHFYGPPFLLLLIEFFGSISPSIFPSIEKWCYCFCWAIGSCLPAAAEACVHVVYIDGILSSCRYIPIIVYYKYFEEWKILDERETKGYRYSNASMRLCVVGSPPFPPVWLFVGVPFELPNGWEEEAEWRKKIIILLAIVSQM